jgi:hypothetical protein
MRAGLELFRQSAREIGRHAGGLAVCALLHQHLIAIIDRRAQLAGRGKVFDHLRRDLCHCRKGHCRQHRNGCDSPEHPFPHVLLSAQPVNRASAEYENVHYKLVFCRNGSPFRRSACSARRGRKWLKLGGHILLFCADSID